MKILILIIAQIVFSCGFAYGNEAEEVPKVMLLDEYIKKSGKKIKNHSVDGRLILEKMNYFIELSEPSKFGPLKLHKSGFWYLSGKNKNNTKSFLDFYIYKKIRYSFDNINIYKKTFKMDAFKEEVKNLVSDRPQLGIEAYAVKQVFSPRALKETRFNGLGHLVVFTKKFVYFISARWEDDFGKYYLKNLKDYYVFENEPETIKAHEKIFDLSTPEKRVPFRFFIGEEEPGDSKNIIKENGKIVVYDIKGMYKKYLQLEENYLKKKQ